MTTSNYSETIRIKWVHDPVAGTLTRLINGKPVSCRFQRPDGSVGEVMYIPQRETR